MALYRTYRPLAFADVIGQDHVVTTLEHAVRQDKIAHAYLFAGSRGTGKTSVARILAKAIMTRGIEDEKLRNQIVHGIEDGSLVDLLEIDAASNRGIDDVRDLIEKIQFSPVVAAAKVYIIDEVHMLTKEAFNALLKTLEEPPEYAHFILATTEMNKIPATIQSRCQCFPFRHIGEEDIVRRLQFIADRERITVEREALRAIAHHVEGGLRDAISLLDQMRSLPKITVKEVQVRIGSTGREYIEAIVTAIERKDAHGLIEAVRQVEEAGIPLDLFLRHLLSLTRQNLHAAIDAGNPTSEILRILDILLEAIRDVRIAPVPGLVVESALLSLMSAPAKEAESGIPFKAAPPEKEHVTKKEKKMKQKQEAVEEETAAESAKEGAPPLAAAVIEAPELTLQSLRSAWPDILEQTSPPSVKMSLKDGEIAAIEDGRIVVNFSSAFHRDKVAATEASRTVEQIMQKIFKRALKLECALSKNGNGNGEPKETAVNLAEAAAEIF
ncbi:MAG: DNA polymerase III subunit gamma/tau [Candidatus Peribacteraceae bacterium]|nr:DNA polymerase III subunit gamma/tau [Candidatus Peribacteraceae bacterium]